MEKLNMVNNAEINTIPNTFGSFMYKPKDYRIDVENLDMEDIKKMLSVLRFNEWHYLATIVPKSRLIELGDKK